MRIGLTLRPGQNGTKSLQKHYGDRLVAVRYRYDDSRRLRLKTAEIIVDESPWLPEHADPPPEPEYVLVRIDFEEWELRIRAKQAGARWKRERKLWEMRTQAARDLGLHDRIAHASPNQDI